MAHLVLLTEKTNANFSKASYLSWVVAPTEKISAVAVADTALHYSPKVKLAIAYYCGAL
jgi:hypothetical protein